MKALNQVVKYGAGVALVAVGTAVQAAAVNVAAVVTDIGAQVTPITAIGGAILLVIVAIAAFKWVRRAM